MYFLVVDASPGYASAFLAIKGTDSAMKLIEVFASSPFHRVVCYDAADPTKSILVTRTDIMKFLYKKLSYGDQASNLSLLCDQNIETCKLFSFEPADRKVVYGIKSSATVITALRYLKNTVLSALPILAGEEKEDSNPKIAPSSVYICKADDTMTGIFTSSLLKGFTLQQLPWLTTKIADFSTLKNEAVASQSASKSEATVRRILELMYLNRLHRVWILEGAHPIGVISAGDIIRWFATFVEV
jgi:CBS-domain-containing membrane protein